MLFQEIKQLEDETDHPPSSPDMKNKWSHASIAIVLNKACRDIILIFNLTKKKKRHDCDDKLKRGEMEGICATVGVVKTELKKFRPQSSRKVT